MKIPLACRFLHHLPRHSRFLGYKLSFAPLLMFACMLLSSGAQATKADVEAELQKFISAYSNLDVSAKLTSQELMYAGINDDRLYQQIFNVLEQNKVVEGKEAIQALAWFAYSLAYSGDEKWQTKLEALREQVERSSVRGYYKKAISKFEKYRGIQDIIAANGNSAPAGRLRQFKLKNMFTSDNPDLIEAAGKEIETKYFLDRALISEVGGQLQKLATYPAKDKRAAAGAALAKAVGVSFSRDQLAVLSQIKTSANNSKLRSAAKSAEKKLTKFASIKPNGLGSVVVYVDVAWAAGGGFSVADSMFYVDYFTKGLQRELAQRGYDIKQVVVGSVGADPLFQGRDTAEKQVYSMVSYRGGDKRRTAATMPLHVNPSLGKKAPQELLALYRNLSERRSGSLPTGFAKAYPADHYLFASVAGNHVSFGAKLASSALTALATRSIFSFPMGFTEAEMSLLSPKGELLGTTSSAHMGGADHRTFLYVGRKLGKQIEKTRNL